MAESEDCISVEKKINIKSMLHNVARRDGRYVNNTSNEAQADTERNQNKSISSETNGSKRSRRKNFAFQARSSKWGSFIFFRPAWARVSSPGSGVGLIPRLLPRREAKAMQASKQASFIANSPSLTTLSFDLSFSIDPITGDYRNQNLQQIKLYLVTCFEHCLLGYRLSILSSLNLSLLLSRPPSCLLYTSPSPRD